MPAGARGAGSPVPPNPPDGDSVDAICKNPPVSKR